MTYNPELTTSRQEAIQSPQPAAAEATFNIIPEPARRVSPTRILAGALALGSVLTLSGCTGGAEKVLCDEMPKSDSHSQKLNPGDTPTHVTITQHGTTTDLGYFKKVVTAVRTNPQTGNRTETTVNKHASAAKGPYSQLAKRQLVNGFLVKNGDRPTVYCKD